MRRTPQNPDDLDELATRMTEPLESASGIHALVILARGSQGCVRGNATDEDTANLLARAMFERDLVPQVLRHIRSRYK